MDYVYQSYSYADVLPALLPLYIKFKRVLEASDLVGVLGVVDVTRFVQWSQPLQTLSSMKYMVFYWPVSARENIFHSSWSIRCCTCWMCFKPSPWQSHWRWLWRVLCFLLIHLLLEKYEKLCLKIKSHYQRNINYEPQKPSERK